MAKKVNQYYLENATKLSFKNKSKLKAINSCYFCLNHIEKDSIVEWIDGGETALCSFCGIDSVIPGEIDPDTLEALATKWFTGKSDED